MKKNRKMINRMLRNYTIIAKDFSQTRSKVLWPELQDFLKYVGKNDKVLDIGCGNARIYKAMKKKNIHYTGIDFVSNFIEENKQKYPNAKFKLVDITKKQSWGRVKNKFDVIFCVAVLHHIPSKNLHNLIIENIHKRLKDKGVLILTVWNLWQNRFISKHIKQIPRKITSGFNPKWIWVPYRISDGEKVIKEVERFHYAFKHQEIQKLLEKNKFKILETTTGRNLCFAAQK